MEGDNTKMRFGERGLGTCTYNATDALGEHVHDLRPLVVRPGPIEEGVETLIQYDEAKIEYAANVIIRVVPRLHSHTNALVYSRGVLVNHAVSLREAGEYRVLVEDPHPQLVNHDSSRYFADVPGALLASHLSLVCSMARPFPMFFWLRPFRW